MKDVAKSSSKTERTGEEKGTEAEKQKNASAINQGGLEN